MLFDEARFRELVREEVRAALAEQSAPRSLTGRDLRKRLRIGHAALQQLLADGLPHSRPGASPRFDWHTVEQWLKERNRAV